MGPSLGSSACGAAAVDVPVVGGPRDPQRLGDLAGALPPLTASERRSQPVRAHHGWSAANSSSPSCCLQASDGALLDEVPFKLGESRHHGEEELPLPVGRVHACQRSSEHTKGNPFAVEVVSDGQQIFHRTAQPVQLPHHQRVTGIWSKMIQGSSQSRPIASTTRNGLFENTRTSCMDEGITLQPSVLSVSGHPRQPNQVGVHGHIAAAHTTASHKRSRKLLASWHVSIRVLEHPVSSQDSSAGKIWGVSLSVVYETPILLGTAPGSKEQSADLTCCS